MYKILKNCYSQANGRLSVKTEAFVIIICSARYLRTTDYNNPTLI